MPIQGKVHLLIQLPLFARYRVTVVMQGEAEYYHVRTGQGQRQEDIVWWYRNPTPECAAIRGYVAFYDEKVDVWVDGEKQN